MPNPRHFAFYYAMGRSEVFSTTKKLDQIPLHEVEFLDATVKSYPQDGFINEHEPWQSKTGHAFFHSRLHLSEPMKLEFLMGYDGPFPAVAGWETFLQEYGRD
jgi:hypothetical protein